MSDSDWRKRPSTRVAIGCLVAIVAVLLASLAVLHGSTEVSKYEREASEKYREYSAHTYAPKRNACLKLPFLGQPDCIANAEREAREYERQEQDLVSQRIMAVWTKLMGAAAITGMLLSALGVYLVWTTFNATRESNEIAKNTAKRQLRAYITLHLAELGNFGTNKTPKFSVNFKNTGQTPAFDVVSLVGCFAADYPRTKFPLEYSGPVNPSVVGSGEYYTQRGNFAGKLSLEHVRQIRAGSGAIWVYGTVRYKDVFDEPHVTHFRVYLGGDVGVSSDGLMATAVAGNHAT